MVLDITLNQHIFQISPNQLSTGSGGHCMQNKQQGYIYNGPRKMGFRGSCAQHRPARAATVHLLSCPVPVTIVGDAIDDDERRDVDGAQMRFASGWAEKSELIVFLSLERPDTGSSGTGEENAQPKREES